MSYQRKLIVLSHQDFTLPLDNGYKNVNDAHNSMIKSLISQPFGKDLCILLITDFWQKNQDLKSAAIRYTTAAIEEEKEERNFNTVLFKIIRRQNRAAATVVCVRSFGNVNMGNYDTLSLMLTFINEKFLSAETALLTWDHGYGFGIFHDKPNTESVTGPRTLLRQGMLLMDIADKGKGIPVPDNETPPVTESGHSKHKTGKSDIPFEISSLNRTDMLTCNELAVAIQRAFHGKKLDLLIFMNCNMMLIDDLYALSQVVKYVVGSESPISWLGYDYGELIRMLSDKNTDLLAVIESLFNNFPKDYNAGAEDDRKWEIISAFDLQKMDRLFPVFNSLTLLFIQCITDMHASIHEYLSLLQEESEEVYHDRDVSNLIVYKDSAGEIKREPYDLCLYDCLDFLAFIKESIGLKPDDDRIKEIHDLIDEFSELIVNSRIALFNGFKDLRPETNPHNLIKIFSGVSFYFPKDMTALEESPFYNFFYSASGIFRSILSLQSFWNELILLYCKYDKIVEVQSKKTSLQRRLVLSSVSENA